jgi:hypothetical protein
MKLFNVTYQDSHSAKSSAYQDLMIGIENSVVGCGSIGSAQSGDLVLICAKKNNLWHAVIGRLGTPLDSCRAWLDQGGCEWPYNWTYLPLTTLFIYDVETKEEIIRFCGLHQLNHKNLFHSRFCSNKLLLAVELLITKFAL